MKIYVLLCLLTTSFISCGDLTNKKNLDNMGNSVRQHFRYYDQANRAKTVIDVLDPISYTELKEGEKETPDDAYLFKVYVVGRTAIDGSLRVYNMNDTLEAYFNKDMQFLRMNNK